MYVVAKIWPGGTAVIPVLAGKRADARVVEVRATVARITEDRERAIGCIRSMASGPEAGWRIFAVSPANGALYYAARNAAQPGVILYPRQLAEEVALAALHADEQLARAVLSADDDDTEGGDA